MIASTLFDDLGYAWKRARRNAFFTLANALLLAMSIGLLCTAFAVLDSLILRRLPAPNPEQLVLVSGVGTGPRLRLTTSLFDLLSEQRGQVTHAFAFRSVIVPGAIGDVPRMFASFGVRGDYFAALGGRATVGRLLASDEREASAVISYRLWQNYFGADPRVVTRQLTLGTTQVPIVGVADAEFRATSLHTDWDVIVPLEQLNRLSGTATAALLPIEVGARMRVGVTPAAYESRINAIWPELLRATAPAGRSVDDWREQRGTRVRVQSLSRGLSYAVETRPGIQRAAMLVFGLTVLIFAGTCLTLTLLAVARGVRHQHSTTLMRAVGATRSRIIRTYLFEGGLIGVAACAGGLIIAAWFNRIAGSFLPYAPELDWNVRISPAVVAVGWAMGIVGAVIIGVTPSVVAGSGSLRRLVQASNRAARPHVGLRTSLLVAQVGLAVLVVYYSVVFVSDLRALTRIDVGFNPNGLHVYSLTARPPQQPLNSDYFASLLARLRAIPRIESAALTGTMPPLASVADASQSVRSADGGQAQAATACVFPGFFDSLQLPLLSGADLTWKGEAAAVITQNLARTLYPGREALGQTIQAGRTPPLRVVGVVADLPYNGPRRGPTPMMFVPCLQQVNPWPSTFVVHILARSTRTLADLESDVRVQVAQVGPQFVYLTADSTEHLNRSLQYERTLATVASVFAAMTILLTGFGLYAFSTYVSALRAKDLAIRAALGANSAQISRVLLREVVVVLIGGSALGVLAAVIMRRLLADVIQSGGTAASELLFGVLVAVLMTASAVIAPIWRGTRLHLAGALRIE